MPRTADIETWRRTQGAPQSQAGGVPQLTNAAREALRANPQVQAVVQEAMFNQDRLGDPESVLQQILAEPLWSRVVIAADGVAVTPQVVRFFTAPTGDGIDQSRFVNNSILEGTAFWKILAVGLAVQDRLGQANWNQLQFNAALFGSRGNNVVFNYPLEAGPMTKTVESQVAIPAAAATAVESWTGPREYGVMLPAANTLKWPGNQAMTWTLQFNAPQTFATPPDTNADFVATLMLWGIKSQDLVGG